jgi:hypothetical protein
VAAVLTPPAPPTLARAILAQLTWRKLLVAQLMAGTWGLYSYLTMAWGFGFHVPAAMDLALSGVVISGIGVNSVLLATVCAWQAVRHGANGWWVYPLALLAASLMAGCAQWPVREAFHLRVMANDYDPEHPFARYGHMIIIGTQFLLLGACVMLVYTNRAREVECIRLTRAAQLRRVHLERQLAQSNLATMQTRLDPEQILDDLARLRDLYAAHSPLAEGELDALVQSLRERTRSATLAAAVSGESA